MKKSNPIEFDARIHLADGTAKDVADLSDDELRAAASHYRKLANRVAVEALRRKRAREMKSKLKKGAKRSPPKAASGT